MGTEPTPEAPAIPGVTLRDVLRAHYLAQVICDGAQERDNPVCACSRVFLGWHPSVGDAVNAWIGHVMTEVASPPPVAAALTDAQCDRLRQVADQWGEAVSAVAKALGMAAALDDADRETIATAWAALKVLSGEEAGSACACGQEDCRG